MEQINVSLWTDMGHNPFESGKCGKEEEKIKNLNISRKKRAF